MSTAKQEVKALLEKLPDDCSLEDVKYHLYVVEKIHKGIERKKLKKLQETGVRSCVLPPRFLSYVYGTAKPLRLEFPGALYHVTSRGDGREDIYVDDADRANWLSVLGQVYGRFNWPVHAYCLMSNHYQVLLETPDGNLSRKAQEETMVSAPRFPVQAGRPPVLDRRISPLGSAHKSYGV